MQPNRSLEYPSQWHRSRRRMMLSMLLAGSCVLAGCAASAPVRPVISVDEIVSMAGEGATPDAIIERVRASRSVYRLPASELVRLKRQGVPDEVLDYMEQTYLTEVCRQAIWDDSGDLYTARTIKDCS